MINLTLAYRLYQENINSQAVEASNELQSVIVDRYGKAFSTQWNESTALNELAKDTQNFLQFDTKLLTKAGFADKCLNIAPEVYWMPNFPKASRYELLWLLRAMDFKTDKAVITELPVVLKNDFRVICKWMSVNYLDAIQEYFISNNLIYECRLRDIHSDTIDISLARYLNTASESFYHSLVDQVYFTDSLALQRREWSELLLKFNSCEDKANCRLGLDIIFSKMEVDDLGDIADRLYDDRDNDVTEPDFLEYFVVATIRERTTINTKRILKWFSRKLTTDGE